MQHKVMKILNLDLVHLFKEDAVTALQCLACHVYATAADIFICFLCPPNLNEASWRLSE